MSKTSVISIIMKLKNYVMLRFNPFTVSQTYKPWIGNCLLKL